MGVYKEIIEAEGLNISFNIRVRQQLALVKKVANNPVRTLEIDSNFGTSVATRNQARVLLSKIDQIKLATTGDGIRFVQKR